METHISTEQLLQIIGEKQVMLDIANSRNDMLERIMRTHMDTEHPPAAKPEETPVVDA